MARIKKGKNERHGLSRTPEYGCWVGMIHRCENPKVPTYKNYGGRGIKVCERWHDLHDFLADMGSRPSPDHSLDRIDNDGDYEPSNCRWATQKEQQNNRRSNRLITFKGKTLTVTQWADSLGVKPSAIYSRLGTGWSEERALSTPFEKFTTIRALIDHYS